MTDREWATWGGGIVVAVSLLCLAVAIGVEIGRRQRRPDPEAARLRAGVAHLASWRSYQSTADVRAFLWRLLDPPAGD